MTYNKTTWNTGDIITADKLNNLENGVSNNDTNITNITENAATTEELNVVSNEISNLATMVDNNTTSITNLNTTLNTKINAEQAVTACMPSSSYINLELGASGTKYTPPASGYVTLAGVLSAADKSAFLRIPVIALGLGKPPTSPTPTVRQYIPISKNLEFIVDYTGTFKDGLIFRFIYAEGNKPNS